MKICIDSIEVIVQRKSGCLHEAENRIAHLKFAVLISGVENCIVQDVKMCTFSSIRTPAGTQK